MHSQSINISKLSEGCLKSTQFKVLNYYLTVEQKAHGPGNLSQWTPDDGSAIEAMKNVMMSSLLGWGWGSRQTWGGKNI